MNINIPGLHNSDQTHWQSYFETVRPQEFIRIEQEDWDKPDCRTWIKQIESQLKGYNYADIIMIGHSIGCMAIVHWFTNYGHEIKGALFVAPTDAEKEHFPEYISGFAPIPLSKLPFPSIVVGSSDDHVTHPERTKLFATSWGSELIILDQAGHIETVSGYGNWDDGLKLIDKLRAL